MLEKIQPLVDAIYEKLPKRVQDEVTLWATIVVGIINVLQASVLVLPPAVHVAIAVVSIACTAIGVRASVTPASKLSPTATAGLPALPK